MAYRYYGGTGSQSPESILRDMEWKKRHFTHEDWKKDTAATKRWANFASGIIVLGGGLVLFGVIALVIWGFQTLFSDGFTFSLTGFFLNPLVVIFLLVGGSIAACRS